MSDVDQKFAERVPMFATDDGADLASRRRQTDFPTSFCYEGLNDMPVPVECAYSSMSSETNCSRQMTFISGVTGFPEDILANISKIFRPNPQPNLASLRSRETSSIHLHEIPAHFQEGSGCSALSSLCLVRESYLSTSRTPRTLRESGRTVQKTPRTPRTPSSAFFDSYSRRGLSESTTLFDSNCFVAVVQGRGSARGEVGMASICLNDPRLVICQLSDTSTFVRSLAKIAYFNPVEVMIPSSGFSDSSNLSKLYQDISDSFPQTTVTQVQRKYFNEARGRQIVQRLCAKEYSSVELQLQHKFYGLAAVCALIKYMEFSQNVFYAPNSLRIEFQASTHTTMIDVETARHVELLVNSLNPKSNNSLFGFLNHCATSGGIKCLRANLFQPPVQKDLIEKRLDAVAELIEKPGIFHSLQAILSRFCDIDQLLSLCVILPKVETIFTYEQRLNNIIGLRQAIELIEPLKNILEGTEYKLFDDIWNLLSDERYAIILSKVTEVIHDNARIQKGSASMKLQRCFAVKSGVNGLLDIARRTYCEIVDDIEGMVAGLSEEYGFGMRVGFNGTRGYHVQIHGVGRKGGQTALTLRDLPKTFLQAQQSKNIITFTTENIIQADHRSQEALREISVMSDVIVKELLSKIRESIGCLYKLSEIISSLDVYVSLAEVSQKVGFVRPTFGESIVIQGGRHPILEHMEVPDIIANDTMATVENNFQVLTGANMSGKSTYLKQLVLLQVMSQVGCFVPADYASFRIADSIFSRIGTGDSIENNASTFMLEMKEAVFILTSLGPTSLVIIDELGRGTSTEEGSSLSWAISEELIKSSAFCFFATHFMLLTRLEKLYCTVANHHFLTEERKNNEGLPVGLTYTHKLSKGVASVLHYGISLAAETALPKEIIDRAKEIARDLTEAAKIIPEVSEDDIRSLNCVRLYKRLCLIAQNDWQDGELLKDNLRVLKERFLQGD